MNTQDRFNLSGKVALVTGANRGIGRHIALGLGECGAAVAVHYCGQEDSARQVAGQINRSCLIAADLFESDAPARIVGEVEAQLGPVDILVLNASIQILEPWQHITREQYDQQMTINLRSSMELMQLCAPGMTKRGWGRIVSVGSVQERKPSPQMLVYAAGKAAMENMVRNLAPQLAPHGVTINNLSPGVIETDRSAKALSGEGRARILSRIPVGFVGQPEDCVGAALLLCSDAGRYITGSTILIDGGWSL